MRITIDGHEIEGTPDEVAELLRLRQRQIRPLPPQEDTAGEDDSPFVSEDAAYRALTRRALAESYKTLLKKLYHAGDTWTSALQLQQALGLSTREFAGLLGALGRRVSYTPGAGARPFFDQYWDHERGFNLYRLPPTVRAALKRAELV